jgi:hypothetical protein
MAWLSNQATRHTFVELFYFRRGIDILQPTFTHHCPQSPGKHQADRPAHIESDQILYTSKGNYFFHVAFWDI